MYAPLALHFYPLLPSTPTKVKAVQILSVSKKPPSRLPLLLGQFVYFVNSLLPKDNTFVPVCLGYTSDATRQDLRHRTRASRPVLPTSVPVFSHIHSFVSSIAFRYILSIINAFSELSVHCFYLSKTSSLENEGFIFKISISDYFYVLFPFYFTKLPPKLFLQNHETETYQNQKLLSHRSYSKSTTGNVV
ncbi:hypothetical protein LEP1GSC120_0689 [Leptospira santarosai str. 200702252]|nr:hypothetical protein LEP1GSC120_0689 [Leptospira santarosai str. 200702252]